ncbi:hypothetical protein K470DRAFT_255627 [Piedraia hortae CBS 480.64]|uniref:Uncharacterized protein n=1 Tax=Piedraia hortae CBS 480.64 TaxID=1314780 RepID=A0A6A7C5E4_9PEZI|nr:hypothetical protein K470DRAFT_255627 [Piedraia hortae CBS 480.64]
MGSASATPSLSGSTSPGSAQQRSAMSPPAHIPKRSPQSVQVEDLFGSEGQLPPVSQPPIMQPLLELYTYNYATGLDRLLECEWYATAMGCRALQQDRELLSLLAQCVNCFQTSPHHLLATPQLQALESHLVWKLMILPRVTMTPTLPLCMRIETIEHLLTGQLLPQNRIPPLPPLHADDEITFWNQLGCLTASTDLRRMADCLSILRKLLAQREHRDVLYSMAVVRHVSRLSGPGPEEIRKFRSAQELIQRQTAASCSQVIQRLCSMAMQSWACNAR